MRLKKYNIKRNFRRTKEPFGLVKKSKGKALQFVVQKHDASHLHFDFRLEMEGVMKSWAIPKGPSLDPNIKRLAMQVEDHPISYNKFEGEIPKGQYGGGSVIVWDNGTYNSVKTNDRKETEKEFLDGLKKGAIHFNMNGHKLKGVFTLIRLRKENEWILIKKNDEYASKDDVTKDNSSVLSERELIGRKEIIKKKNKKIKMERIKPMLATLIDKPFSDKDWIYEIKWDGYRALANINNGKVDLYSRNFISFNDQFPSVVNKLSKIKESVILDGEIVAYDEKGNISFQEIQNSPGTENIEYMVFDILNLEGEQLTSLPQIKRKQILKEFLRNYPEIKESDYIEKDGEKFFKFAAKKNLEGIMAKKKDGPYYSNQRTNYWLKIKNQNSDEAIIAGFTEPRGSRKKFGALVLGIYRNNKLKFAGHVGTGFSESKLEELYEKMKPIITKNSPFEEEVPINSPITWIKPKLIAQLKFTEWTKEKIMRQPVFWGLREDKEAKEVTENKEISVQNLPKDETTENPELKLTNLDKIYFPKSKITKGDVISYYKKIAPIILFHLKDRPENLNRHPNGINKPAFFHKNFTTQIPSFVQTEKIYSESNEQKINYLLCQNLETLLYMTNLGCIEINPWNSRIVHLDYPDYMIFDLDPRGSTWPNLITVAQTFKKILDKAKINSYIKTSGKAGLHIYVPLGAKYNFEDIKNFSHIVCQLVNKQLPSFTSLERNPAKRKNKIYLDYLQNRVGQTTAVAYSIRPIEGANVSTPLKWTEVKNTLDPAKFNINTIESRIKKIGDIWKPVITQEVDLKKSLKNLERSFNL